MVDSCSIEKVSFAFNAIGMGMVVLSIAGESALAISSSIGLSGDNLPNERIISPTLAECIYIQWIEHWDQIVQ